jgi:hypothetical protein
LCSYQGDEMDTSRDLYSYLIDKKVIIVMKNRQKLSGILKSIDADSVTLDDKIVAKFEIDWIRKHE